MPLPVVVVLAAGKGRRFLASGGAGHKLSAPLAGMSVLDHVLLAVAEAGLSVHVVRQADGEGMGDSIAAGVRATADAAGWLILPGDLPLVRAASLRAVAAGLQQGTVVVPHHDGQAGHPVGFSRACAAALCALTGDHGAASVVQAERLGGRVVDIALDDPGLITDVDTHDDLLRVQTMLMSASILQGECHGKH
ncbi:NTP transferase domain-containing protein [uncultured Oxalicibacterium sp.]|uniref:nucleotidyltransferase family protein n=1 Tax=uncultured Oxalicibacterium sp. TaxID=1168540 RepID=UPI0025D21246|nr:NTP transferase domain-containing protein [uncultured Oxalicibacterium sp.]